jgi:hypothetical protein
MHFPFEPSGIHHKHGGRITRIERVGHECAPAKEGRSQDIWFFVGDVEWSDGGKSNGLEIAPYHVCWVDEQPEGEQQIRDLMAALNEYLQAHGEWCDRKSKHEGWYANEGTYIFNSLVIGHKIPVWIASQSHRLPESLREICSRCFFALFWERSMFSGSSV